MVSQTSPETTSEVIYPDSDGQPMSDNTKQFRWIVTIKENLELLFAKDPNVFVAGDLLWYPVEGNNTVSHAPDAMVVFGRPKGDRGSYRQWQEDGIAPQVVFEILYPGNRMGEMNRKLRFYERYGVEEYYIYDPDRVDFTGWIRSGDRLEAIDDRTSWISPRLRIEFRMQSDTLVIYHPDGWPFMSFIELDLRCQQAEKEAKQANRRTDEANQRATEANRKAAAANQRATEASQRVETLGNKLREMGIDPASIESQSVTQP
jgi:Uma2 family endonuclease